MAKIIRTEQDYIVAKNGEKIQLAHCLELEVEPGYLGFKGGFTPTGILGILDGGKRIIVTAIENDQNVKDVSCFMCGAPANHLEWAVRACSSLKWIDCCSGKCLDELKQKYHYQNVNGCLCHL